jgi:large subunit ribosomal protein L2
LCDISLTESAKVTYSKAKGCFSQVVYFKRDLSLAVLRLTTYKLIYINLNCMVTIGRVGGKWSKLEVIGFAGYNKILGKKSKVRGVAMNPVDHPHGGRTKTVSPEVSP